MLLSYQKPEIHFSKSKPCKLKIKSKEFRVSKDNIFNQTAPEFNLRYDMTPKENKTFEKSKFFQSLKFSPFRSSIMERKYFTKNNYIKISNPHLGNHKIHMVKNEPKKQRPFSSKLRTSEIFKCSQLS